MYVQNHYQMSPLMFNTLTRKSYDRIASKVLYLDKHRSTPDEEQIFQLSEPEDIWTFERARIVDFKIKQIEKSKLPVSLFPDLNEQILEGSIQEYVQDRGYVISHSLASTSSSSF